MFRWIARLLQKPRSLGQQGMALVLTLACISFLVVLTLQLMTRVDRQWDGAVAQQEELRLDALVQGGLQLARAALLLDRYANDFDSFFDAWNTLDAGKVQAMAGDEARLSVVVADMGGRLQVNALARSGLAGGATDTELAPQEARALERYRGLWWRFLASGRFVISPEEIDPLLDALADWVDKDQNERPLGAEDGYYLSQNPPYSPANAPIRFEEELLLVRGMSRALLYGDAEHEGILPYITVAGNDARLNPNTAPLPVLLALLPDMSEENGQDLQDFRANRENREALASPDWLRQVRGLPAEVGGNLPLFNVKSQYFAVQVVARRDRLQRVGTGLIERRDNGEQGLLLWRVE